MESARKGLSFPLFLPMIPMSDQEQRCCSATRAGGTALLVLVVAVVVTLWWRNFGAEAPSVTDGTDQAGQDPGAKDHVKPVEPTWETEQFSSAAKKQLHLLVEDLEKDGRVDPAVIVRLSDESFRGDRLRPETLETAYQDERLTVQRARSATGADEVRGREGLTSSLEELVAGWNGWPEIQVHFKITSVELHEDRATTRVLLETGARRDRHFLQQRAWWQCGWILEAKAPPRLVELRRTSLEEISGEARGGRLFAEATAGIFSAAPQVAQQLADGVDHWRGQSQAELGVALHGHHGLAIGDVNGDGLEDVYLCQPGGLPNRLLLQQPDGTVKDTAASAGVDWLDGSRSALLLDLDNDGDQDLVVALNVNLVIMANDGRGQFVEKAQAYSTGDPNSLSAADFDGDGDLDVYVAGYGKGFLATEWRKGEPATRVPYPYHDANNGGPNLLLRNDGDWRFTDATAEVGLNEHNSRWSFAAGWADYDSDGDPDLYVANDYGRNCLYRNDEGRFHDVAAEAGVEDIAAGMSVSWCDYNGDGRPDLYIGNMFSSAGERIAYQREFQPGASEEIRSQFQRHARGNTLFENSGDGTFRDVSVARDVTLGRWAWGSPFVDINNDGRADLVVANGYITGSDPDDL